MTDARLELRRQLHRDSMRRHRQRQFEGVTSMRVILKKLTHQFQELGDLAAESPQILKDFRELALSTKRLQEEQLQLQGSVVLWQKVLARLIVVLSDHPQRSTPIPTRMLQDPSETVPFRFEELTEAGRQQVIRRCSLNIRTREQRLPPANATVNSTFGWSIVCDLTNDSDVFVSMTKRLPGITAHQARTRSWKTAGNPALYPHLCSVMHEMIQVVPERAYVEVRDMPLHGQFEGKNLRSCMMGFVLKTERGYAIGMGSVAPEQRPVDGRKEAFVEHSSWTELVDDVSGSCVATVSYRGQYNSGDTPYRRFLNLFSSVRRWEDVALGRSLKLPVEIHENLDHSTCPQCCSLSMVLSEVISSIRERLSLENQPP